MISAHFLMSQKCWGSAERAARSAAACCTPSMVDRGLLLLRKRLITLAGDLRDLLGLYCGSQPLPARRGLAFFARLGPCSRPSHLSFLAISFQHLCAAVKAAMVLQLFVRAPGGAGSGLRAVAAAPEDSVATVCGLEHAEALHGGALVRGQAAERWRRR